MLAGVAPANAKWEVDTTSGQPYYVSGGNWSVVPGPTVDISMTISSEAGNVAGVAPLNPPAVADIGDIHLEIYDDFLVWWSWTGASWVNSGQVATNPNAATNISPQATDAVGAVGAVGVSPLYAREDHKHPAQNISADTNNALVVGVDGLHTLPLNLIAFSGNLTPADNTLHYSNFI